MYESLSNNPNSNSSSAGGKKNQLVKSFIVVGDDTAYIYPKLDLEEVLLNESLYSYKYDNFIVFSDVDQLSDFYTEVFNQTNISNSNGYSLGPGTQLKDLQETIILKLEDDTKVIEWQLVKQLTGQSSLPIVGSSPDNSEGYIVTYSDWDLDGTIDPIDFLPSILGYENGDVVRIVDGPMVNK